MDDVDAAFRALNPGRTPCGTAEQTAGILDSFRKELLELGMIQTQYSDRDTAERLQMEFK